MAIRLRPPRGKLADVLRIPILLITVAALIFMQIAYGGDVQLRQGELASSLMMLFIGLAGVSAVIEYKLSRQQIFSRVFLFLSVASLVFSPLLRGMEGLGGHGPFYVAAALAVLSMIILAIPGRD